MSFTSKGQKEQPEKDFKPKVDTPKYNPEKEPNKPSDKPAFNPNIKPRNKIEPYTLPPNHKPKNKIERCTLPLNYKPKNKIKPYELPLNYKSKNKIQRLGDTPKIIPQSKPRRIYSEMDVRYWIQQYKHYRNFKKVQYHLQDQGIKVPGISTIPNRIKELIGQGEYKELMKKYTFKDANKIVRQAGINKSGVPGKILSDPEEFKGVKSKLLYQCGKCNH